MKIPFFSYWYSNGCLFPDMGTVFIAIDKCDLENGCLKVLIAGVYTSLLLLPAFIAIIYNYYGVSFRALCAHVLVLICTGAKGLPSSGQN